MCSDGRCRGGRPHMLFLQAWLLFPVVLALLSLGTGLLLRRLSPVLPAVLVLPVGFAGVIVVATLLTYLDATAELAAPALAVVAVAGLALGLRDVRFGDLRQRARGAIPPVLAALLPAGAIAAPVVLTGRAGFTGYGRIVDGALQLDYTQYLQHLGVTTVGVQDSSYLV